ncbi:ATP-binding protein [Thiosocius teredinicola]|uniref:ATP-binding protein n=1 Tax=Thiosocius teredinicola TaxID=1973002 RepID=UPI000990C208
MIIHKIRAENVLKYAKLSIDLSEHGLIAISGPNESGKSSIGETLCFALFGRTFSIGPGDIQKVIRWGENHCNATTEFSVEGTRYELTRFLDRDGNHSAKLARDDDPEDPIARGVNAVGDALFGILGFEYDEFVESFYLAQREITTPHPHSHAVKIMAGIAPLEHVANGLQGEIEEREELLGEIQAEWEAVDQDVKGLGIEEGRMPRLEDERYQTHQQREQIDGLINDVNESFGVFSSCTDEIYRAESKKGRSSFLRFILFLLAVALGGVWALLTYGDQLPQTQTVRELLAQYIPQWDDAKVIWIAYAAAAVGVLFLLSWIAVAGTKRRIARLRAQAAELGDVLGKAREIDVETASDEVVEGDDDNEEPLAVAVEDAADEEEVAIRATRPEYAEYQSVRAMIEKGDATIRMVDDYCERETGWLKLVSDQLGEQIHDLDGEIDDEQSRVQEAINLSDVLNGLTDKREEVEERIEDRHRALELLQGAIAHLSGHFNRDIKELVGKMLPLFTDGRYEHLQIDPGLKVRVFSSEKRDFMDLDEVSSGTQRQIMLALRLALSKKLLSRTVKGKQFAFLDEPFAFFDQERTRQALHALANLGDDISQVWIVSQDFPENCEETFDTTIHCDRDSDTLNLTT